GAVGMLEEQPQPVLAGSFHPVALFEEDQTESAVGGLHPLGVLVGRAALDGALLALFPLAVEIEGGAVLVAEPLAASGVVEQEAELAVVRIEPQRARERVRRVLEAAEVEEVEPFGDDAAILRALGFPHLEEGPFLLAPAGQLLFTPACFFLLQALLDLLL